MVSELPEAQPGYRWELQLPEGGRRKRSPWPWIVSLVVLIALLGGAWFAGEWLARDVVTRTIRTEMVSALGLGSEQGVDVRLPGSVLAGVIGGSLNEVIVRADDVDRGELTGDLEVTMRGVPVRGEGPIESGTASLSLDEAQLRALLGTIYGFPVDAVSFSGEQLRLGIDYSIFGASGTIGVDLQPGADAGALTLTPSGIVLGEAQISADELRQRLGPLADAALRSWSLCLASKLPAGATLQAVTIANGSLRADAALAPTVLSDPAMREPGACP